MATYVTSKKFRLPEKPDEFTNEPWYNMWSKKLWPYKELKVGDTLYWYESPKKCIVWRSRVVNVQQFPYQSKEEVKQKLQMTADQAAKPYFVEAPESGYCVHYEVEELEQVNLPKPKDFSFPQQGWLKVTSDVAEAWPGLTT